MASNEAAPTQPVVEQKQAEQPAAAADAPAAADAKKPKPKAEKKEGGAAPAKAKKGPAGAADLSQLPEAGFVKFRFDLFDALWAKQQEEYAKRAFPIKITLMDGKQKDAQAWVTKPQDIAEGISKGLGEKSIVAKVNDQLWDMQRPFEGDCTIEFLSFDDDEARKVFWHSSAHLLGQALERVYGIKLNIGPPLEDGGFFYEGDAEGKTVSENDYPKIETAVKELMKSKSPFQRLVCPKDEAVKMFEYNPYKANILRDKVPEGGHCTIYRCGNLVDPCRGPHILHTGKVGGFEVTKNSSAYYHGKADEAILQRVYGMAFPTDKEMKEWQKLVADAKLRDHRHVGIAQELFMFHQWSPGCAFWYPRGAHIYNKLIDLMKKEYRKRGYQEVICPNVFHKCMWETSGHWEHYQENIFQTDIEKETHALKPMNCPGHMLLFGSRPRSYRELPLRFAEFGVLHRNEASGALSGLTRVRRFVQDDSHIFIQQSQIMDEISNVIGLMDYIYNILNVKFHLALSTRNPKKWTGDIDLWNYAEAELRSALLAYTGIPDKFEDMSGNEVTYDGSAAVIKKFKLAVSKNKYPAPKQYWEINPEDAAFYGPKIDIQLEDCMKRKFQCATVQLDFVLPERFKLQYVMSEAEKQELIARNKVGPDGKVVVGVDGIHARPVVVHRAILGSLERCIGVLTEHYGGKWPFWLSPRQIAIVPCHQDQYDYARELQQILHDEGFEAEADLSANNLKKKIANNQVAQFNIILVVGNAEKDKRAVNIRVRDSKAEELMGEKPLDEFISWLKELRDSYSHKY